MTLLRRLCSLAFLYAGALILGFLLYLTLIASPLLGSLTLLFYRGVAIAFLCVPLMAVIAAFAARRFRIIDLSSAVGGIALSLAFNISFLIVFPVTFDRSITMFLLARIEQQDGQLDTDTLEGRFVREYLGDLRQIDRRVREQSLSGNIRVERGHIWITPQGRRLLAQSRIVGRWFGADPRFVTVPPPPDGATAGRH